MKVSGEPHVPVALPPGKPPVAMEYGAEGAPEAICTVLPGFDPGIDQTVA
jgi:hypothetical protein